MATRSEIINASRVAAGFKAELVDLTPTPLTAPGVGPWVPCLGRIGFVHGALSDTTTPAASWRVEGSNTMDEDDDLPVVFESGSISGAKKAAGGPLYAGPLWIRFRLLSITGVDASAGATVAWAKP